MLDLPHLPERSLNRIAIFNRPCTVTNTQWELWRKPRGVSVIHILCVGGGAGGGIAASGAASSARGGGGGGGSSGHASVTIPAHLLPDTLYIQVGNGGASDANGVLSYVSVYPNTSASNVVAVSGAAAAVAGANGGSGGLGGSGGTIPVIGSMPRALLGNFNLIAGQGGANGGSSAGANGSPTTIAVTGAFTQGGSGGAGTTSADFQGGGCTAIADTLLSEYRPATPAAGSFNGSGGSLIWKPFFSFGGLGGSSSNTGIGGVGGNGGYGSGGGGGGGGTTGGSGGRGGQGIVIISAW